jgi:hypothetical protein
MCHYGNRKSLTYLMLLGENTGVLLATVCNFEKSSKLPQKLLSHLEPQKLLSQLDPQNTIESNSGEMCHYGNKESLTYLMLLGEKSNNITSYRV